jgi:hypothetical protein
MSTYEELEQQARWKAHGYRIVGATAITLGFVLALIGVTWAFTSGTGWVVFVLGTLGAVTGGAYLFVGALDAAEAAYYRKRARQ